MSIFPRQYKAIRPVSLLSLMVSYSLSSPVLALNIQDKNSLEIKSDAPFEYHQTLASHSIMLSQYNQTSNDKITLSDPLYIMPSPDQNWDYLMEQTYTILGLSVATVGFMTLLPESITKWDDDDRDLSKLGKKWRDNVSEGPVWDRDEHFLNYVMHPYFGGVYYTAARHAGYNEFKSFMYSFTMSTFFWEYGVEAFAEVPSWQDIFITPFFGAMVGEMMFSTEQDIIASGGKVMGSQGMGDVSLFLLNPVGHIHHWVKDSWGGDASYTFSHTPWFDNKDAANFAYQSGAKSDKQFFGMQLKVTF